MMMKYEPPKISLWKPLLLTTVLVYFSCSTPGQRDLAETGSMNVEGFRLTYRIEGTGTPAIVIGSSLYYSRAFSQNLRKHLRLVFMDHRGFVIPPDSVDPTAFELNKLIDDVERVRRELGLGRIAVIGHSGHSYMALEYAKKYPERVTHVVMIGISPDLSDESGESRDRYWDEFASPERKALMEEQLRRIPDEQLADLPAGEAFIKAYIRDAPRIWYDPHFDSSSLWEGVEINMDMINHVWGKIFREIDITRGLDALDRPVFLALGRHDFLLAPPSAWDPVRPKFQDLTIRVFERSGHTPQYEEAVLFDKELLGWMRERM
jgi:proline iminopeptidase